MSISFTCPQCHRLLRAKNEQAGKKAKCSGCKKVLTIPESVTPRPEIEEEAASAFTDGPQEAAPQPEPTTITFHCMYCDEEVTVAATEEGKQTPCPECRRIVKVPLRVKAEPKDWRKGARAPGAGLRRDALTAPEGAWGTVTSSSTVSRQALIAAEVIIVDREPTPLARRIIYGLIGVAAALVLALGVYGFKNIRSRNTQKLAITKALAFLDDNQKPPLDDLAAGEIYRAVGEYLLREGNITIKKEQGRSAQECLAKARERLSKAAVAPERDVRLIDLALTQIDLGGDKAESDIGRRLSWNDVTKELAHTLQHLAFPDARVVAVRAISRKLIALGQGPMAESLAFRISPDKANPELQALVGLEMHRAGDLTGAKSLAMKLLSPYQGIQAAPGGKLPTVGPNLLALLIASEQTLAAQRTVSIPSPANAMRDPDPSTRLGYAEGYACQGKWDQARLQAATPGAPDSRLDALVAVASLAEAADRAELVKTLEPAVALLSGELKDKPLSPWLQYRIVQLAAEAGLAGRVQSVADAIVDGDLKNRAQLEILRSSLAVKNEADKETFENPAKQAPLLLEAAARHNSRFIATGTMLKELASWDQQLQPYGYVGMALGEQDAGQ